jgi:hypothetical protein
MNKETCAARITILAAVAIPIVPFSRNAELLRGFVLIFSSMTDGNERN